MTPAVVEKGQTTEIGTVTPGLAGDALSLKQTGGSRTRDQQRAPFMAAAGQLKLVSGWSLPTYAMSSWMSR